MSWTKRRRLRSKRSRTTGKRVSWRCRAMRLGSAARFNPNRQRPYLSSRNLHASSETAVASLNVDGLRTGAGNGKCGTNETEGVPCSAAEAKTGIGLLELLERLVTEDALQSAVIFTGELLNQRVALFARERAVVHRAHDLFAGLPLILIRLIDHGLTQIVLL